jgi:hypothetical protein
MRHRQDKLKAKVGEVSELLLPMHLSKNEILCRHTEDDRNQCETCLLCDGASSKPNIADKVHGLNWKVSNFLKYLESTSN